MQKQPRDQVARTLNMRLDSSYGSPSQQHSHRQQEEARTTRYARHVSTSYTVERTMHHISNPPQGDSDLEEQSPKPPPQTHNFGGEAEVIATSPIELYATANGGSSFLIPPSPLSTPGNSLRQQRDRTLTPTRGNSVAEHPYYHPPQRTDKAFSIFNDNPLPVANATPTSNRKYGTPPRSTSNVSSGGGTSGRRSRPSSPATKSGGRTQTSSRPSSAGRGTLSAVTQTPRTGFGDIRVGAQSTPSPQREIVGANSSLQRECRRLKSFAVT